MNALALIGDFTVKLARDRGNTISTISSDELELWQKTTATVETAWLKDAGASGPQLLKSARGLLAKYAPAAK